MLQGFIASHKKKKRKCVFSPPPFRFVWEVHTRVHLLKPAKPKHRLQCLMLIELVLFEGFKAKEGHCFLPEILEQWTLDISS